MEFCFILKKDKENVSIKLGMFHHVQPTLDNHQTHPCAIPLKSFYQNSKKGKPNLI